MRFTAVAKIVWKKETQRKICKIMIWINDSALFYAVCSSSFIYAKVFMFPQLLFTDKLNEHSLLLTPYSNSLTHSFIQFLSSWWCKFPEQKHSSIKFPSIFSMEIKGNNFYCSMKASAEKWQKHINFLITQPPKNWNTQNVKKKHNILCSTIFYLCSRNK